MSAPDFEEAERLVECGRELEALEAYRTLERQTPDPDEKAVLILRQVSCLTVLERFKEAKDLLNQVASCPPGTAELRALLEFESAKLLMAEGKDDGEALNALDALLGHYPSLLVRGAPGGVYESIQMGRGMILARRNRFSEALNALSDAKGWYGDTNGALLYYLGHCHCGVYKMQTARDVLLQALKLGLPQELEFRAHFTLGIAYYHLEAYAEAKHEFEVCAARADQSPYASNESLWRWLAATSQKLGLKAEAERCWSLARNTPEKRPPFS